MLGTERVRAGCGERFGERRMLLEIQRDPMISRPEPFGIPASDTAED